MNRLSPLMIGLALALCCRPGHSAEYPPGEAARRERAPGADATNAAVTTLEAYGGQAFYKPFWRTLTYTPLGDGASRVTYQGAADVFDDSFVGKWLEPSRIHHNAAAYPPGTLKMDLRDWTLRPSMYNPKGFMLMQPKADPAHAAFIRINGE